MKWVILCFETVVGSWGRLLSKVGDHSTAESIIEHKATLGVNHQYFISSSTLKNPDAISVLL